MGAPCTRFHGIDDLPVQLELLGGKIQELLELIQIPDMGMDRSASMKRDVLGRELVDQQAWVAGIVRMFAGCHQILLHVSVIDLADIAFVLVREVIEGRRVPVKVECTVPIGNEQDEQAAGSQHTIDIDEHGQRIGEMFDDVAGDNEVLALVGEPAKAVDIEIRDDVGFGEPGGLAELWEQRTVLLRLPAVDVSDFHPISNRERDVPRTDLHPLAPQSPPKTAADCQRVLIGTYHVR